MLADPRRVEPERLRQPDQVEDLAVLLFEGSVGAGWDLSGEQADADVHGHGGERYRSIGYRLKREGSGTPSHRAEWPDMATLPELADAHDAKFGDYERLHF